MNENKPVVSIVVVSHSQQLAEGLKGLASAMAPDVTIVAVGGRPDGTLGTSSTLVEAALVDTLARDDATSVVVLADLGSAVMTAEAVVELLPAAQSERILVAEGPFVEGTVAAAVAAQPGDSKEQVSQAAADVARMWGLNGVVDAVFGAFDGETEDANDEGEAESVTPLEVTRTVTLTCEGGLHARPAAQLAKLAAKYSAKIQVDGVDATSVLMIMSLGRGQGDTVTLTATGDDAEEAMQELVTALA